ncbi:aldehyde ferredoxin oxidoreductase N-terminal domain-containing protein [Turicimonas muris]|uniref:aldehyde ferredoxin oxidoreductase N-terminal domain-containing protein n=1 Tax=Turicimonas muris TaxID=1796652 RepID=UPI002494A320|nr:aldehyde ferredoxin oxidoreductase N-terminal domain-containing protein [Turicimonas muris]
MDNTQKRYGYTGQGLRVNLTTGQITKEPTFPRFKDEIGGTAIGYRVFWDEVPPKTQPLDEANKLVIAPGPFSGSGALCSSRTSITTIYPTIYPIPMIASAHIGGDLAAKLKLAGYDFIIIEGKSDKPVYLYIDNDEVEIRDAKGIWGQGTRRAQQMLANQTKPTASVAVIGPAGENLVPMSVLISARQHSGGGIGSIFGSKKLKGVVVNGDQPIHIHADKQEWQKINERNIELFGSLNQHVVPSAPNPLFEFYAPGSRWNGMPGNVWQKANPPIILSEDMRSPNRISYRWCASQFFLGKPQGLKIKVRNNGCYGCPLRCYAIVEDDEAAARYHINKMTEQTCMSLYFGRVIFPKIAAKRDLPAARQASMVGIQVMDDLGVWCNYGQLHRDFKKMYVEGRWKKVLPEKEYNSIPWQKIEDCDASFLMDFFTRIAYRQGEMGKWLGESTAYMLDHFGIPEDDWRNDKSTNYWALSHPKHHANEDDGQVGTVLNCLYNRDPMSHGTVNFTRSGLPIGVKKTIAERFWGSGDAVDEIGDYTPTNEAKMRRLRWVICRKELHDMLGLCSWMAPWVVSPNKSDNYIGDDDMEGKVYRALTGRKDTAQQLDNAGFRAFTLHRAYTMRQMNELNMRKKHDFYPNWIFTDPKNRPAFTKGTIRMDKDDIEKSFDIFFEMVGWDPKTGAPTEKAYKEMQLDFVVPVMQKKGLMPGK